jgi:hypothetical protein
VCARITRFYVALITIIKEPAAPEQPSGVAGCGAHIASGTSRNYTMYKRRERFSSQTRERKIERGGKRKNKEKKILKPWSLRDTPSVLLIF